MQLLDYRAIYPWKELLNGREWHIMLLLVPPQMQLLPFLSTFRYMSRWQNLSEINKLYPHSILQLVTSIATVSLTLLRS